MELNKFITGFANQFEDTPQNEFNANTVFQELEEWSSLTTLSIIAFIKTDYNKDITNKEIRSCETIEELFNIIKNK